MFSKIPLLLFRGGDPFSPLSELFASNFSLHVSLKEGGKDCAVEAKEGHRRKKDVFGKTEEEETSPARTSKAPSNEKGGG